MKATVSAGTKGNADVFIDGFNKRCRVDDYTGNFDVLYEELVKDERLTCAEKLIWKVKSADCQAAFSKGMVPEGMAGVFFRGEPCWFFAKYFTEPRKHSEGWLKEDRLLEGVYLKNKGNPRLLAETGLRRAGSQDAEKLARFYKEVFPIYPVPIDEPDYIKKSIEGSTVFMMIELDGIIASAASAEIDEQHKNAEITDCATLAPFRKQGHLLALIHALENLLAARGIFSAYSLARARSFGMNQSLYQCGYRYGGRLINNCYISEDLENMNLWWKDLSI
ncbi:putative beta-lysine N-acetyltransferase [Metabacillus sp. 84]|uniref:putative beta-lysine N-acetyltransferase n=1 Tax=unclassified Metabacillus TaxID=2675274 RepID=UPI003CE733C4